jgi:tRNA pseudouridine55 synthase
MNSVLIIDKPAGLTSHDVVNRARRILGESSVGHLGTLDPMATGVLPLVTGNFTRLAQFYVGSEKVYEGTIRFGFSTDTYDAEGAPTSEPQNVTLPRDQLESAAAKFRGVITQTPPPFSAKKIKGVPAYKLARKQKEIVLQPVQVEIKEFEFLSCELDRATFRARVASGTYMRSIAHDLGQLLACGAHLESLRRTAVAEFTLADAHTLEKLAAAAGKSANTRPDAAPPSRFVRQGDAAPPSRFVRQGKGFDVAEPIESAAEPTDDASDSYSREAAQECSPRRQPWEAGKEMQAPEGRKNPLYPMEQTPQPNEPAVTDPPTPPISLDSLFIHPRKLLPNFPSVTADELAVAHIRTGRPVNLPELSRARQVKVFSGQRDLVAIATRVAGTLFHPKIVLCTHPGK